MKIVFVLLFIMNNAGAVVKKDETAQSKEIIEIAQNLILQKDREQAIRLLNKAYTAEKNKNVQTEIRNILKDIGSLFLYDKSQQEYESSINFKKTDPNKWFAAVEKAQKIEPDNTLIMYEIIRNHINKKNIEKAKEVLDDFRLKNSFDKYVILASVFLALAVNDVKESHNTRSKLKDLQLPNYTLIQGYLDFLEKMASNNKDKAQFSLVVIKKEDPQNPQIPYWESKLAGKSATGTTRADDEPICSTFPEHYFRRYQYDLFFCSPALEQYFKFKDIN